LLEDLTEWFDELDRGPLSAGGRIEKEKRNTLASLTQLRIKKVKPGRL